MTYKIGYSQPYYGAEFYELVSSFDNSAFQIPYGGHTFTFQEEMRLFKNAVGITPLNRENINDWITTKMKEAYGLDATVSVEDFPRNQANGN